MGCLAAAKIATDMFPANALAWQYYGPALYMAGRNGEALAAYDQALTLDPNNVYGHNGRGNALQALGRYDDALAAYDQAIAADQVIADDPGSAFVHENKGILLVVTGDLDGALAELDTADRLNPAGSGEGRTWAGAILWHRRDAIAARDRFERVTGRVTGCTPFRTAEMEAVALCGLGQPDAAERNLVKAVSQRADGDQSESRAIYDLLADPPLPGIDRLRAIIDNRT
jgi:tetratricopeptide (TPR) repeat protein